MSGSKTKGVRFWTLKIFFITLITSGGISVVAEVFMSNLGILPATLIVIALILLGVIFDIIGVAFASCDQTPFIAMSAKKIKKATRALKLLKNAEIVSNICNDVIGDVCSIVSGAAGAAIVAKIMVSSPSASEIVISILISSVTAACTVAGKALGKGFAMNKNVKIVETIGAFFALFERNPKTKPRKGGK